LRLSVRGERVLERRVTVLLEARGAPLEGALLDLAGQLVERGTDEPAITRLVVVVEHLHEAAGRQGGLGALRGEQGVAVRTDGSALVAGLGDAVTLRRLLVVDFERADPYPVADEEGQGFVVGVADEASEGRLVGFGEQGNPRAGSEWIEPVAAP